MRRRVITIIGTRPEVIKMAPVVREIERRADAFEHRLVTTAQHREMLDQVLDVFGLTPDVDLGLMQEGQSLGDFASRSLSSVSSLLTQEKPDAILVQGDTTTSMIAALAAFYQGVHIGHVEAGLRTRDRRQPFPEEINRRITGVLADLNFAPTPRARVNLLNEGVPDENIFVTGNTIVDALSGVEPGGAFSDPRLSEIDFEHQRVLLVTAHRRENHGEPLRAICRALRTIAAGADDVEIIYPVHLNPNVNATVRSELANVDRIHLVDPVSYRDLLMLMNRSYLVLTDSGGIQEEAPSFHKPVLVLREVTERPELIEANGGVLVGTDAKLIIECVDRLLSDPDAYARMASVENPFGDGHASERIVEVLAERL